MKVKHYNEMMGYLTRPGFNGGGSVKKKPVLPKRKPPEEVKKRQKINYEKIKQYLEEESREFIERELGFELGGAVAGGEAIRLKNLEQRSQIDNWLKVWLDNNFKNYEVRDKDKFLKDLKKDWKKAQKTEFKNNRLAQAGDLPSPTARFKVAGSGKNKRVVPNKKFFSMFDEGLLQSSEIEKDRFYRRLFYAGQIDTNPELKKDINNYFKTVLIDKRKNVGFTQSQIDEFNKIYKSSKAKINANLIKLIGMDGEDDFYAAIGEGKKMRVISSKQSPDMKKFVKDIRNKNLNITMVPKPGSAGRASVTVTLSIGTEILTTSSLTMTDTGIGSAGMTKSKGAIKTNFWFNFNDIA